MHSVFVFGTTPPPVGGVTKSVENTLKALSTQKISTTLFSPIKLLTRRKYDIVHIHYLKRWKILTAILLGKLLAKKTILTYHGSDFYPDTRWFDHYIYKLLDGIVVLNQLVLSRCTKLNPTKAILLTPIFQEGLMHTNTKTTSYFKKEKGVTYILLYASRKDFFNGTEVYGCHFVFTLLKDLPSNHMLVFLDPNRSYAEDMKHIDTKKIIYIDRPVDFTSLLLAVDIYIRPTSRDGNSIATLEALSANIPVLASDVVDRGTGVHVYAYNDSKDFTTKLLDILSASKESHKQRLSSITSFENFCDQLLREEDPCAV